MLVTVELSLRCVEQAGNGELQVVVIHGRVRVHRDVESEGRRASAPFEPTGVWIAVLSF